MVSMSKWSSWVGALVWREVWIVELVNDPAYVHR